MLFRSRKDIIESLLGVENFHCGPFEDIDKQFDMISMVYVIEHLFDPMQAMLAVRDMLSPEGLFFIHTSDLTENPFDLPVVDHCSHFTLEGLEAAVTKARFEVLASSSTWCPKEIGVIARVSKNLKDENIPVDISKGKYIAKAHLTWLAAIRSQGLALADESPLGVFGTSNAGVWLTASMRELVSFFVDDDEKKQGKSYLDLPVYGLDAIPEKTSVLLAFPTTIAQTIAKCSSRKRPDIHFHIPKHTGE